MNIKYKTVVLKFGGSVIGKIGDACPGTLQQLTEIIQDYQSNGWRVVVVISAFSGETKRSLEHFNKLCQPEIGIAPELEKNFRRESDVALASDEQKASGTLAGYLNRNGISAQSFQGWQIPIYTNDNYKDANIIKVGQKNLRKTLDDNTVSIVSGFQGIFKESIWDKIKEFFQNVFKGSWRKLFRASFYRIFKYITTLGFDGSDYTAAAIAAALDAEMVVLFKDEPGVFTENPKKKLANGDIVKNQNAKHIPWMIYPDMMNLAKDGAGIVHHKAISAAEKGNIPIIVRNMTNEEKYSFIGSEQMIRKKFGCDALSKKFK